MKLIEDSALAAQMVEDVGKEIHIDKPLPHVTELIYCLTRSYLDRTAPLPPTPQEVMLFSTGIGLEAVMLKSHKQQIAGEVDGIHFSTDFLDYKEQPGELKTTRISEKTAAKWLCITGMVEKDKKGQVYDMSEGWRKQILAYLHCNGATEGTLAVLHLMGNYAPPFPTLRAYHIEATAEEVETNWKWLLHRKAAYMAFMESDTLPEPGVWCMDWECGYGPCRYKLVCDARKAGGA